MTTPFSKYTEKIIQQHVLIWRKQNKFNYNYKSNIIKVLVVKAGTLSMNI